MNFPTPSSDYLRKLITDGACSLPVLNEDEISALLEEAAKLPFKPREQRTAMNVMQNFSGCDSFEPEGIFDMFAQSTASMLDTLFDRTVCAPIEFNDYSLQLYPVSEPGEEFAISPHLDHKNCINLIAVYVLKGKAPFYVCKDRTGADAIEIGSNPGDLILMRGTGFLNSDFRPFHFVGKVAEERMTFGMRQTVDKKELPKYSNLERNTYGT